MIFFFFFSSQAKALSFGTGSRGRSAEGAAALAEEGTAQYIHPPSSLPPPQQGVSQMSAPTKARKREGRQRRFTSKGLHVLSGKRVDKEVNRGVKKGNLKRRGSWECGTRNQGN